MGFENIGKVWTPTSLAEYLKTRKKPDWVKSTTIHHIGSPSLADRPSGFSIQHIINIADFYRRPKEQKGNGWSSGPHLFTDDDQIFGMCDFAAKGVHAVSFNSSSIGIEVLDFYDKLNDDPKSGRGLACWKNTAETVKVLLDWLWLKASAATVKFHRDDPLTKKSCPNTAVEKDWFLGLIPKKVVAPEPAPAQNLPPDVGFPYTHWHFAGDACCVPIAHFLVASGLPQAEVIAKLTSKMVRYFTMAISSMADFTSRKASNHPLTRPAGHQPANC